MGFKFETSVIILVIFLSSAIVNGYMIGNNPYHRAEFLDLEEKYYLEWEVDLSQRQIHFHITVATNGYLVFGLANNASVRTRGDYVIAGVWPNGDPYFLDGHGLGVVIPEEDLRNDCVLHAGFENGTHTHISFSRAFDTCDPQDYPITDNTVTIIWGYGLTDDFEFTWNRRIGGSFSVYLLDPEFTPRIVRDQRFNGELTVVTPRDNLQLWSIRRRIEIPNNTTSYICSVHQAPRLQRKHHMVGFDIYFRDQSSRQRTHHIIMNRCNAPRGANPRMLFGPYVGGLSQTCVVAQRPPTGGPIPTHLCTQLFAGWAIGGRAFFTPPHVGVPFGETPEEYYLLQVHYDNPAGRPGVTVDLRMDIFFTSHLRSNDGGIMGVGQENPALPPSIILPPTTTDHRIFSHCPGECTRRMMPRSGIKIVAGLLHSHNSGKRLRLRHFGEGQEQPWVLYDDNYNNNFQEFRHLKEEVRILPGDQLTMECIYDNTWTNGTVVGGFSTTQEMCLTFLFYYNRIEDYSFCRSEIVSEEFRRRFLGVSNVTWNEDLLEWVAVTPRDLSGLTMTEVSDYFVNWDGERRQALKMFHEAHPHVSRCSRDLSFRDPMVLQALAQSGAGGLTGSPMTNVNTPDDYNGPGTYPFRDRPYFPEESCSFRE